MKKLITLLITLLIISYSCSNSNSIEVSRPKTPEELKMELVAQEKLEPLIYLSVDGTMQEDQIKTRDEGVFHDAEYSPDGNTIHGTIKNVATMAKFKDVIVTVTFYSQTGTAVEAKDFVIYEFYGPNSTNKFSLKVYPPEAMSKFGIDIKGATAVD